MSKMIVTHMHPDLDGICAAWLLTRFGGNEYEEVSFGFVPAGSTFKGMPVDSDPEVVHVDTGMGMFDHHDPQRTHLCASILVLQNLVKKQPHLDNDEALREMVKHVNEIDQFGDYYWPEPNHTRYAFMLSNILQGIHVVEAVNDERVMHLGLDNLDAVYQFLKDSIHAKKEVESGREFMTPWGKGIAIMSGNDAVMKTAQKMGYAVVVRKDPDKGFIRIKAAPLDEINLRPVYNKILKTEDEKDWYFHPNGHMILNGSTPNPYVQPTRIKIDNVVRMIEELGPEETGN